MVQGALHTVLEMTDQVVRFSNMYVILHIFHSHYSLHFSYFYRDLEYQFFCACYAEIILRTHCAGGIQMEKKVSSDHIGLVRLIW